MNFIEIIDDNELLEDKYKQIIKELINCAFEQESIDKNNTELSISFVNIYEIHQINKEYRNIDRPTDVISFALNDEVEGDLKIFGGDEVNYLGDIVICVDIAKEQAIDYGHSFERELGFLAVHGFLHLLGYDHINKEDEKKMFEKQEIILEKYGLTR